MYIIAIRSRNSHSAAFRSVLYEPSMRLSAVLTGVFSKAFFVVILRKAEQKGTDPMKFGWGSDNVPFFGSLTPLEASLLTPKLGVYLVVLFNAMALDPPLDLAMGYQDRSTVSCEGTQGPGSRVRIGDTDPEWRQRMKSISLCLGAWVVARARNDCVVGENHPGD